MHRCPVSTAAGVIELFSEAKKTDSALHATLRPNIAIITEDVPEFEARRCASPIATDSGQCAHADHEEGHVGGKTLKLPVHKRETGE